MKSFGQNYSPLLIILFVGFFSFFINLGSLEPDIMEARNFTTVREILDSGDWLHPTMNGKLRLAKPPLPTWITAIVASVTGLNNLLYLRLPAALMALWLILSMYSIVKKLSNDKLLAMLSSITTATMLYVLLLGRRGTWDIYTHSFILASALQFLHLFGGQRKILHAILGGIFFGASFLSKGPVGFYTIFLPFVVSYIIHYRRKLPKYEPYTIVLFGTIGIILAGSWYYYIYTEYTAHSTSIIGHEVNNWVNYNVRPWYYYLKDYPVHAGVWALTLILGLFSPYLLNKSEFKKPFRFFWVWTIFSIILLSIIPEKKIRYLLPTFIPAAFIVATYLRYLVENFKFYGKKNDKIIFIIHWTIFLIISIAIPIGVYFFMVEKSILSFSTFIITTICSMICCAIFLFSFFTKKYKWFVIGIFILIATINTFILPSFDKLQAENFKNIAEVKEIPMVLGLDCYALEETRIELVWHIGKKIKEVKSTHYISPPYILLTDKYPTEYLKYGSFQLLGYFDNNSKPKGHRHYRESLSKYVSVVMY